ncbi:MAG: Beta-1,3-glucosyltransferase [Acidobacteria bacterium]|nr:Beta-1,3-glucosyltransferase [Acidobacteriota bacterium]
MTPRVSVLLPVYRPDLDYLRQAIASVVGQTFTDWELVLVEDRSSISIDPLLEEFADGRIRRHQRDRKTTLAHALDDGLAQCAAPLVARFDSDDLCAPQRLAEQVAFLDRAEDVAAVGSSLTIIDAQGRAIGRRRYPTDPGDVARAMRRYNAVAHPAVLFRRDIVLRAGGYGGGSGDAPGRSEDYALWCRLLAHGARIANLPAALVQYRFHAAALKRSGVHDEIRAAIAIKRQYFGAELTIGDRVRLLGEHALFALPESLVVRLFQALTYR